MHIRRLVPADAPAYRALMLVAYERHPDAFTSSADERAASALSWRETRLADGDDADELVFGAFDDGLLAGVAGLSFFTRARERHKAKLFGMSRDAAIIDGSRAATRRANVNLRGIHP